MILKLTIHEPDGYAVIECPPAGNDLFKHSSAMYDKTRKAWLITALDVTTITGWLRQQGHIVVTDTPRASAPAPAAYDQLHLGESQDPEVAHRGAAACRAALRAEHP